MCVFIEIIRDILMCHSTTGIEWLALLKSWQCLFRMYKSLRNSLSLMKLFLNRSNNLHIQCLPYVTSVCNILKMLLQMFYPEYWYASFGLGLFNDDTCPLWHISRPTHVNVSQELLSFSKQITQSQLYCSSLRANWSSQIAGGSSDELHRMSDY